MGTGTGPDPRAPWTTRGRWALAWVSTLVVLAVAVIPPERCSTPPPDQLEAAIDDATNWLLINQRPDGTWLYDYDRDAGTEVGGYNMVRHAGVTMSLYMRDALQGDRAARDAAERGLAWLDDRLVAVDGSLAFADGDRAETGTAALALAALVWRRDATGRTDRDPEIVGLADFVAGQVFPRGAVSAARDLATGRRLDEVSRFFTGEALWALALVDARLPGHGWGETAGRIADHIALRRDDEEPEFPPNDDHWAAYGLAELAQRYRLADHHLAYAERLAGLWSAEIRFDAQRTGSGINRIVRGSVDRGGQQGTNLEGIASLWRLARVDSRLADARDDLAARVACAADLLVGAQVHSVDSASDPRPDAVAGAWFTHGRTRMDTQQHALSGLLGAWRTLRQDDGAARAGPATASPPAASALAAATVAALVVLATAGASTTGLRRARPLLAAAPAVVAALLGHRVLAGLEVSATTARLAVGMLVAARIGHHLLGAASPGSTAARTLTGPAVVITATVAGADLGPLAGALAVIVGMAVGLGLAGHSTTPVRRRVVDTLALTVALAAAASALTVGVVGI